MPPATRMTDVHACLLMPAGPVTGPCVPTVLTGRMPQAVVGDLCACIGPPDAIVRGSASVFVGKRPSARIGDATAKGGATILGWPTVIIGDAGGGAGGPGGVPVAPGGECLRDAAAASQPFVRA